MGTLSPKLASELAFFAYSIREQQRSVTPPPSVRRYFKSKDNLTSKTGGYLFNKETGFAALGYGDGPYSGDAIIAIRGTKR